MQIKRAFNMNALKKPESLNCWHYFKIVYGFYNHMGFRLAKHRTITFNFGGEKGRKIVQESLNNAFVKGKK